MLLHSSIDGPFEYQWQKTRNHRDKMGVNDCSKLHQDVSGHYCWLVAVKAIYRDARLCRFQRFSGFDRRVLQGQRASILKNLFTNITNNLCTRSTNIELIHEWFSTFSKWTFFPEKKRKKKVLQIICSQRNGMTRLNREMNYRTIHRRRSFLWKR